MVVGRGILLFLTLFAGHLVLGNPLIVAHRGASFDAPENTLPAFELAWEKDADAIEGDFLLTNDNRLFAFMIKRPRDFQSKIWSWQNPLWSN